MRIVFNFFDEIEFFEAFHHFFASIEAIQTLKFTCQFIESGIGIDGIGHRKGMSYADFKVIRIMRRSDFHTTGSKCGISIIITDDRNCLACDRYNHIRAYQMLIAFIIGIHGNRNIPENRFGSNGCHIQPAITGFKMIAKCVNMLFHFTEQNFFIAQCRLRHR